MAQYTETLKDFLDDYEETDDWTAVINRFALIPDLTVESVTFDAYDMFKRKYLMREIGSESEEKFIRFINMQLDVATLEYLPKIKAFTRMYADLESKSIITETKTGTATETTTSTPEGTYTDTRENTSQEYLNPISTQSNKLKETNKDSGSTTRSFDEYSVTDAKVFSFDNYVVSHELGISNPALLAEVQKVKSYLNEFIDSFDICFMGVF